MRIARRWTEEDLQAIDQRAYGFVHIAPPALSKESAEQLLAKRRATRRKLEALFEQYLTWSGMRAVFETQVRFHPTRQWQLDFYAEQYRLAVELHGGVFSSGRHVTGTGFTEDRTKINAAHELGITVLEFTSAMLSDGTAIAQTERLLMARGWSRST